MESYRKHFQRMPLSLIYNITLIIICSFLFACQDEEEGPTLNGKYNMSDLAGNWTATEALFSSLDQDYKGSMNIIQEGGSLTMNVQNDGKFTINIVIPGEPNEVFKGKLGFEEEWLTVSYDTEPDDYEYFFIELNDDKSILTLRGEGTYDFDDDGMEDLSSINLILERN